MGISGEFDRFFASKKHIILDGDGTLYLVDKPMKGAKELIRYIRKNGKDFTVISNNDSLAYRKRLSLISRTLGVKLSEKNLLLPTQPAIRYLKEKKVKSFDGLMTAGLRGDFVKAGIKYSEKSPQLIIIAFDTELTYGKLRRVVSHINNGVDYIVTHTDRLCPVNVGSMPDAGSMLQMVREATHKEPLEVIGKPSKRIVDYVVMENRLSRDDVLIIGDRADTDIMMARAAGIDSVLIAREKGELDKLKADDLSPIFVFKSLSDMVNAI